MSFAQVKEFMSTFGQDCPEDVTTLNEKTYVLRLSLIKEEFQEFLEARAVSDIVEIADALTDLKYVVIGSLVSMGIEVESSLSLHKAALLEGSPETLYQIRKNFESEFPWLLEELEIAFVTENTNMSITLLASMLEEIDRASIAYFIDIEACMDEVHASNMSKLGADGLPIYRDDGKVIKGPNFFEPNLTKIVLGDPDAV